MVYQVDEKAEKLAEAEQKVFHMEMVKLLFLAKCVCPDILMVISFSCKHVMQATVDNRKS